MSPTPRRVKKLSEQSTQLRNRNRAMAIIGVIVILAMFLGLVVTPGAINPRQSQEVVPTYTPSLDQLLATMVSEQATSQALTPTVPPITATAPVTPTSSLATPTP